MLIKIINLGNAAIIFILTPLKCSLSNDVAKIFAIDQINVITAGQPIKINSNI